MKKSKYVAPAVEIVTITSADIMSTSPFDGEEIDLPEVTLT